jgi:hypothetical protein
MGPRALHSRRDRERCGASATCAPSCGRDHRPYARKIIVNQHDVLRLWQCREAHRVVEAAVPADVLGILRSAVRGIVDGAGPVVWPTRKVRSPISSSASSSATRSAAAANSGLE